MPAEVGESADALDPDGHAVAVVEVDRRIAGRPDTRGRPGEDEVGGAEGEGPTTGRDEFVQAEDEIRRRRVLQALPVDVGPDVEVVGVVDLVEGHQFRTEGSEGVEALAPDPLSVSLL